jgi:hypothetical protein
MIGHQAEAMHTDRVSSGKDVEPLEISEQLDVGEEDLLLVVAALVEVIDVAALPVATAGSWDESFSLHTNKWIEEAKILDYFENFLRDAAALATDIVDFEPGSGV